MLEIGITGKFKFEIFNWTLLSCGVIELQRSSTSWCDVISDVTNWCVYTNPPINSQNDQVWSQGKKFDEVASHLLVQRAKFASHIMVSADWRPLLKKLLHWQFVAEAGVRCSCVAGKQLCFPAGWCTSTWGNVNAGVAWQHCPDFIDKDAWPPNSPDLNPLDYCMCGAMLEEFNKFNSKTQNNS